MPVPLVRTLDRTSSTFKSDVDLLFVGELNAHLAEYNATAVAMNLNSTTDTSATSHAITPGDKTFTVSSGKSFQPGMYLVIADTAAASTNSMYGQITTYSTNQLLIKILSIRGSGTKTAWTISQSASGFGTAADITNTPAGGIAGATVQAALNELDTEKANIAAIQAQTYTAFTTTGTPPAYAITPVPAITAYTADQAYFVNFHAASVANPTLAINGLATPPQLVKQNINGTYSNIAAGDIPAGHRSYVVLISATQALVDRLPAAAGGPVFSAYANASQSLTSGVFTKVAFQTELYDSNNNFDAATNFRWTPTVAGYYRIQTAVRGTAVSGMTSMAVGIYKNGVEYSRAAEATNATNLVLAVLPACEEIFLNGTTDFVEIYVLINGTTPSLQFSTASVTSRFSASFVRGA